jgi:hypothetical protein
MLGFDDETSNKRNLPFIDAMETIDLPNKLSIDLVMHEVMKRQIILYSQNFR